jgi:SAM-dependent methyltransferase
MLPFKYQAELNYWWGHAHDTWLPWYRGELPQVHEYPAPKPHEKVKRYAAEWVNAVETYSQASMPYYPGRLRLDASASYGRMADIGSGPMGFVRAFPNAERWEIDPLMNEYDLIGYPVRDHGTVCLAAAIERLWMIPSNFFDTIVSVNAIDHVDDFEAAAAEIQRVAKPTALIRFESAYHPPSVTEPNELTAERVRKAFNKMPLKQLEFAQHEANFALGLWST